MAGQGSSTSNLKPSYDATLWHPTEAGTEISALLTEIRCLAQHKCAAWWKVFLKLYTKRCSQRQVREVLPSGPGVFALFSLSNSPKGDTTHLKHSTDIRLQQPLLGCRVWSECVLQRQKCLRWLFTSVLRLDTDLDSSELLFSEFFQGFNQGFGDT